MFENSWFVETCIFTDTKSPSASFWWTVKLTGVEFSEAPPSGETSEIVGGVFVPFYQVFTSDFAMDGADQLLADALVTILVELMEGNFFSGADGGVNTHGHGDEREL